MILKLKIDVTNIDKTTLFKGQKGVYLDATVLIKDAPDQYGNDGMIVQDVSKEAREAGQKGPILGNAKWATGQGPDQQSRKQESKGRPENEKGWDAFDKAAEDDGEPLPF